MNFDFSEEQRTIQRTARELLAARMKPERLRELAEGGAYDEPLWDELVGLGWPGIAVSEAGGGQGLGCVELVILAEELGYALAPVPFLSTVAAALALDLAAGDGPRDERLAELLSGRLRGTAGEVRDGRAALVPDAVGADLVVLLDGEQARLLEAPAAAPVDALDMTRRFGALADVGGAPLGAGADPLRQRIATAIAAESVGVAQRMLEAATAYAKERKQFGKPIGVHQAVSHRCAQMLLETECARSACYFAAWAADHEPESLALAASAAKAYASDAGWRVTASALQVFGGIGFTWEHDLHFFLKRARTNAALFGSAREHRERVAELIVA